jgi:hypothetical protein
MAGKAIDLTGRMSVRLTAIERAGSDERGKATWKGVCDCGNAAVIVGYILGVALLNASDRPGAVHGIFPERTFTC